MQQNTKLPSTLETRLAPCRARLPMPLQYTISQADHTLVVTAEGPVGREDMDRLRARLLDDDRIVPGTRMLFDTRHGESHLKFTDLKDIANRLKGLFDKGINKVAVVAESHFIYSLATTFGVFARYQPVQVKPFRKIDDAMIWLRANTRPTPVANPLPDLPEALVNAGKNPRIRKS